MRPILVGLLWLLAASPAWPASEPAATTTGDLQVPVEELKVLVKPLTKEELETEVEAWHGLVRRTAGGIAEADRALRRARSDADEAEADTPAARRAETERTRALEQLQALQTEQTERIERLRVALHSYARKGGEVEPYERYVDALQHVEVDPSGWESAWAAFKGWLVSSEGGVRLGRRVAAFLAILAVTGFVARGVGSLAHRAVERSTRLSELSKGLVVRSIRNLVLALGLVVAVASLGVSVGPLLAVVGAAGFVVAFALQGTLGNFASGLMILFYRPFDVGDFVRAGGVSGKVAEMNLVSTTFLTFDNQRILVPNDKIWGDVITNVTAEEIRRVDLTFSVAYDSDLERVEQVLRDAAAKHELVLDEPAPAVVLTELGDSAVVFACRPWSRTEDYWTVYWDLLRTVKKRFDDEGITIPFPQRDVHLRGNGPAAEPAPPERAA